MKVLHRHRLCCQQGKPTAAQRSTKRRRLSVRVGSPPLLRWLAGADPQQDAWLLVDHADQQVVDVLLQLRDLVLPLGQLKLLLHHQRDELLLGELGVGSGALRQDLRLGGGEKVNFLLRRTVERGCSISFIQPSRCMSTAAVFAL